MASLPLLFRIFYNSFYTLLSIVLLALILITPSDAIRQALSNRQLYNVFVIAACYFVTALLALLIYASRIYTTRSVLAGIPKTFIPIEEGDVTAAVRAMIGDGLKRSALVAWNARPRVPGDLNAAVDVGLACPLPEEQKEPKTRRIARKYHRLLSTARRQREGVEERALVPSDESVWGEIRHSGWSSPTSPDLANLHYTPVILELPHLIEAKAVSLSGPTQESLTLLPRPMQMGLREYVVYLLELGVLAREAPWKAFLEGYEYARFSCAPLTEPEFRRLMHLFADVLRGVRPLGSEAGAGAEYDSDIDDDASGSPTPEASLRSQPSVASIESAAAPSEATVEKRESPASRRRPQQQQQQPERQSSASSAPLRDQEGARTPRSAGTGDASSSDASGSQSRRPCAESQASSRESLRSSGASRSGSGSEASVRRRMEGRAGGSPGMRRGPVATGRGDGVRSSREWSR